MKEAKEILKCVFGVYGYGCELPKEEQQTLDYANECIEIREGLPSEDELVIVFNKYIKSASGVALVSNRNIAKAIHKRLRGNK